MAEAALLSTLGGAAGLGVGIASSSVVNTYYQRYYDTTLVFSQVTGLVVTEAAALALLLGILSGIEIVTRKAFTPDGRRGWLIVPGEAAAEIRRRAE